MDFYLQRLQDVITEVTRGMTAQDLAFRKEGKWCAGEILEHLYLTFTGTTKGFERCLNAGKPKITPPTWKQRAAKWLVVGMGRMPKGRVSPKNLVPRGMAADRVLSDIGAQIAIMDEMISRCEHRYGTPTKLLDHPILGPLTGKQWRKFHWVHGRHHVAQIIRLKQKH
ncbi:MAG TPA: DUF1569 domain-containing protein [Terriglobales bacterium]|nr:DUF1569 domain-containing protein [Terriglobales bacterium]